MNNKLIFFVISLILFVSCKSDGSLDINTEKELNLIFVSSAKFDESENLNIENFKLLLNYVELKDEIIYAPIVYIEKRDKVSSKKSLFEIEGSTHSSFAKKFGTYGATELKSDYENYFKKFESDNKYLSFVDTFQSRKYTISDIEKIIRKEKIDFLYILDKNKIFSLDTNLIKIPIFTEFQKFQKKYVSNIKSDKVKKIKVLFWRPYENELNPIINDIIHKDDTLTQVVKTENIKKKGEIIKDDSPYFSELKITKVNEDENTIHWKRIKNVTNYIINVIDDQTGKVVVPNTQIDGKLSEYNVGSIPSSKANKQLKITITAYLKDGSKKTDTNSGYTFKKCK